MSRRQSTPEEVQAEFVRQTIHAARRMEHIHPHMPLWLALLAEHAAKTRREDCRKPVALTYLSSWGPA